jgi:hypothetical protein
MPSRRTVYSLTRTRPDRSLSESRSTGKLIRTVLPQANAYAMIRLRAAAAGIATKLGNHSFRVTGITAYLKNGGTLEKAAAMANHTSTRTTQLYDRRRNEVSLDTVERIVANPLSCPGSKRRRAPGRQRRNKATQSLKATGATCDYHNCVPLSSTLAVTPACCLPFGPYRWTSFGICIRRGPNRSWTYLGPKVHHTRPAADPLFNPDAAGLQKHVMIRRRYDPDDALSVDFGGGYEAATGPTGSGRLRSTAALLSFSGHRTPWRPRCRCQPWRRFTPMPCCRSPRSYNVWLLYVPDFSRLFYLSAVHFRRELK